MFKVEIIVEDKKLANAVLALDGLGYELQVHPIKGATVQQGQLRETRVGTEMHTIKEYLKVHLQNTGAMVCAKDILNATGVKDKNLYNSIARMVAKGQLRRTGTKGQYTINPAQL